ncbi:hypothetical protein UFOVP330_50 [uncultured Caudovirales phage]|uniref:Uncharacterized protein n=1 Tax=uncultured Caudovirales phage TaxID=2100421 RepID=A0A6J5LZ23_9CAUD|nr:hypothetical protein UFOVP330_50 [uncultured Caudovirales phage]
MPKTYTQNLGVTKPADGEEDGVWGDLVNENMDILDRASNGQVSLTLTGTSSNLTTLDGDLSNGQYKLLILTTGTGSGTHTITIQPNTAQKIYYVINNSTRTAVFTQGSGGDVSVLPSQSLIIYANGGGASAAVNSIAVGAGGATGGGLNKVFYENDQNVTASYTITSNKNAMTAGPVTIDAGVTVTVPSGSVWSII